MKKFKVFLKNINLELRCLLQTLYRFEHDRRNKSKNSRHFYFYFAKSQRFGHIGLQYPNARFFWYLKLLSEKSQVMREISKKNAKRKSKNQDLRIWARSSFMEILCNFRGQGTPSNWHRCQIFRLKRVW